MSREFKPQRQDSLHDQLKTVRQLANEAGCYDAADFIRDVIEDTERRLKAAGIADVTLCDSCNSMTKTLDQGTPVCGKCGAWKRF
jgi:hypothetical protein